MNRLIGSWFGSWFGYANNNDELAPQEPPVYYNPVLLPTPDIFPGEMDRDFKDDIGYFREKINWYNEKEIPRWEDHYEKYTSDKSQPKNQEYENYMRGIIDYYKKWVKNTEDDIQKNEEQFKESQRKEANRINSLNPGARDLHVRIAKRIAKEEAAKEAKRIAQEEAAKKAELRPEKRKVNPLLSDDESSGDESGDVDYSMYDSVDESDRDSFSGGGGKKKHTNKKKRTNKKKHTNKKMKKRSTKKHGKSKRR